MKMKTILLTLCFGLVFLGGCGRSKPQASKTVEASSPAAESAAALPPDQQPPKPAPASAPQPAAAPVASTAKFGPLPPNQDPSGDASLRKYHEQAAKLQQNAHGQELERKRLEALQSQPQSDTGQSQ